MTWQAQYQSREHAEFYANKRDATLLLRLSNYFERRMILRALHRVHQQKPFRTVLDCASGTGRMLPMLSQFDVSVLALDTSAEMLAEGRRYHGLFHTPPQMVAGSATDLPLPDNAVDLVLCSRLLHHFPDAASRIRILGEFARVARVGVVVSFFDLHSYRGWRRMRKKRKPHRDHGRFAISRQQLQEEARAAGLQVVGMNALLRFHTEVTAAAMLVRLPGSGEMDGLRELGLSSAKGLLDFKPTSVAALSKLSETFRVDCEPTSAGGPTQVYVKRYRYAGWGPKLRGMFRGTFFGTSRARLEHEFLTEMRRRGVPAVKPLKCIEDRRLGFLRSAALITEGVPDAKPLDLYWPQHRDAWPEAQHLRFVEALAQSVSQLHQAGVRHGGLYARNILVRDSNSGWDFFFLDPSRRCRLYPEPAPPGARVADLSDLAASCTALNWEVWLETFLRHYCGPQASTSDVSALGHAVRERAGAKSEQEDHRVAVGTVLAWLQRRMEQADSRSRPSFESLEGFFDGLRAAKMRGAVSKPTGIRFEFGGSDTPEGPKAYLATLGREGITVTDGAGGTADLTIRADAEAWLSVINARPEAIEAIRSGRVELDGDVRLLALLAQRLE